MLQVEAWDQDCSPQYSQICNYEIVTAETPFAIDRNGECVSVCLCVCASLYLCVLSLIRSELGYDSHYNCRNDGG